MSVLEPPYFIALPEEPADRPGIVVIHEGNGMTTQLLRFCERLAAEGFAAIAPDLFARSGGPEAKSFEALIAEMDQQQVLDDLVAAARVLRGRGASSIGVTGFCMGGLQTWRAAISTDEFSAAVAFYGSRIANVAGEPRCPTLVFFGGQDDYIPTAEIEAVAARHPDTVVYPDAGHGFMRDGSDSFHPEAAADAWRRMLEFFRSNLG